MNKDDFDFVALRDLRIGLFVDLDLGWMAHPFASSRFKISSDKQVETLRGLGVARIRYIPAQSDPQATVAAAPSPEDQQAQTARRHAQEAELQAQALRQQRLELRAAQKASLAICERRFAESAQQYRSTLDLLHSKPQEAAQLCQSMVRGLVAEMAQQGDSAIRLLTEAAGDKAALHPVNVTVISLLLGHAMGMKGEALEDLGLAAFLHDIGKVELPERVRRLDDNFSSADHKVYQDHVTQSVRLATQMQISPGAVHAIAQHHELVDGSGFPLRLKSDAIGAGARILALVNRYDGLCNPPKASAAMTPHEALSLIFAQLKTRFDAAALSSFIRMMGVYPPGSVVQLNDERHAMVVSVNSGRPLKPRLIVHEPGVSRHEALVLDLEHAPNTSIRRSLKPSSLPAAAFDFLQPRVRICYFCEPAANVGAMAVSA
jgi:putative nucleotidyltransferase with HDIG domain